MTKRFRTESTEHSERFLSSILHLENLCFPESFLSAYGDSTDYYRMVINCPDCLNIYSSEDNIVCGYALGVPLDMVYEEISTYATLCALRHGCVYVDTIQIDPLKQGQGIFRGMIHCLLEEARLCGFETLAIHARTANQTDSKVVHLLESIGIAPIENRHLEKWHFGGGEPYKFLCFPIR